MAPIDFIPFGKIPRLRRDCIITEKIDGTNASVWISNEGEVFAASRTRWITPEDDNFGFARWVSEHQDDLKLLGPGQHFGEWWGQGIQRRYGLTEKRFSLFNTGRWTPDTIPACVSIVPVLAKHTFSEQVVEQALHRLRTDGSVAAPGFMNPEGIVVYLAASRSMFKVTLEGDEKPKGSKE